MGERVLNTGHGPLRLPAFLPDATRGVVRTVDAGDLRGCGVEGLVVNAFHLGAHPGGSVVEALGGIHAFMGWTGPVLSDSGGYQLWSLLQEGQRRGKVTRRGFHYQPAGRQEKRRLTPEKSIRLQFQVGADIVVCLDHCTHPGDPPEVQRESVENTVAWARAGKAEYARRREQSGRAPLLFAVIQGGDDEALRRECAARLLEIGFDGYGFGGRPVTDDGTLLDAVPLVAELVPDGTPSWALGLGKPEHVARCAGWGYGLFDCVLPTRDARHQRLYAFRDGAGRDAAYDYVYLQDEACVRDGRPVDPSCDGPCCASYSRAYLHHLFAVKDALGPRLATIHNLRFYVRLMDRLRR